MARLRNVKGDNRRENREQRGTHDARCTSYRQQSRGRHPLAALEPHSTRPFIILAAYPALSTPGLAPALQIDDLLRWARLPTATDHIQNIV